MISRGRTRVQNACQRCRKHKIKCSGIPPCRQCRSRGFPCDIGAEDKHVWISEKELFHLRSAWQQLENQGQDRHQWLSTGGDVQDQAQIVPQNVETTVLHGPLFQTGISSSQHNSTVDVDESWHDGDLNPLAPDRPAYVRETCGRLLYLGHSSTYAFTQQVLHSLQQNPPTNPSPEILLGRDGEPDKSESIRLIPLVEQDVSRLPSKGTALHYLQSIRFRTQPLFYLFDDTDFTTNLQRFYADAQAYAEANRVWYAHYLVLMAFGKALDPHEQLGAASTPLVPEYLTRALRLLPDMSYVADYMIEATELLLSLSLFLQSTDHRHSAILYGGLAVRMSQLYGLHLELEESILGCGNVERCRRLWWSVYALSQRLTVNNGLPNLLIDRDITNHPPVVSSSNEDDSASGIHVKICRLLGLSIRRVYGTCERDRKSFVATTQTVLREAAVIATEVKTYTQSCFGGISRVSAHLELAHHQCVMITCRPALFCLLKLRSAVQQSPRQTRPPIAMAGLVQVCVDSATHSIQVLDELKQNNLVDTFLPFDLECGFSAAFILVLASFLHPKALSLNATVENAKNVIRYIALRGNREAKQRVLEIELLEDMLRAQGLGQGQSAMDPSTSYDAPTIMVTDPVVDHRATDTGNYFFSEFDFGNADSEPQMMNLADALSEGDFGWLVG